MANNNNEVKLDAAFLNDCKEYFQKADQLITEVKNAPDLYRLAQQFLGKHQDYMDQFTPAYSHITDDDAMLDIEPSEDHDQKKEDSQLEEEPASEVLCEVYYRLAFQYYTMVQYNHLMKNKAGPTDHAGGLNLSRKSLQYSPTNKWALYYYTIIVGIVAELAISPKQKSTLGKYYYRSCLKLIKCHTDEPKVYHLLARFQFQVSKLTWIEKTIAAAVFGKLPEFTYAEVEDNLRKTQEAMPNWSTNHLYLAKCLISQKRIDEASKWVNLGLEYKPTHPTDQLDLEELYQLKNKYKF